MKNDANTKRKTKKILLVSGGTGGHIWPAISFGQWLTDHHPDVLVEYISGTRPLEQEIYRSANISPRIISIEGSPLGAPKGMRWRRWRDIFRSYSQTRGIMKETKPDLCILFGGYVSLSSLLACIRGGIPVIVHEQNAQAGRVTQLAHKFKVPIASGWNRCDPFQAKDFTYVGVPVRAFANMSYKQAMSDLMLEGELNEGPIVSVMTGSLGSQSMREKIEALSRKPDFLSWNFLVITPDVQKPDKSTSNLFFLPIRWDISPLYAIADMFVLRGGASTLTEALLADKPAIVIPWAKSSGGHQMKNAQAFASVGKALIWDEATENINSFCDKIMILQQTYSKHASCQDKRMYNAPENICEKLWDTALRATKGEVRIEGRHSLH